MYITKIPFIGKKIKITNATIASLKGKEGEIIYETKHRFIMKTQNQIKKIDKQAITFQVCHKNTLYDIRGKDIAKSPLERIKAKVK